MRTSYIEQMNVADRNNSLRGYFGNLCDYYCDYYNDFKKISESCRTPGGDEGVFSEKKFSFAHTMSKIIDPKLEIETGEYSSEEFNALKFRLAKNLNLIQAILYKICHDTIDSSIVNDESSIEVVKQAITWQFVDCVDANVLTYQDMERLRLIIQDGDGDVKKLNKESDRRKLVAGYKDAMRKVLNELFKVLADLVNFSQYLLVVEELSVYSQSASASELRGLRKKPHMSNILLLAETVKEFILTYLVSFVKVKELVLPHSFMKGARFSHSILYGSNLMSSELSGANFEQATMRDCDLSMCALDGINAYGADFTNATLNYATLAGANLSKAVLKGVALNSVAFIDNRIISKDTYYKDTEFQAAIKEQRKITNNLISKDTYYKDKEFQEAIEEQKKITNYLSEFTSIQPQEDNIYSKILEPLSRSSDDKKKEKTMDRGEGTPLSKQSLTQDIDQDIRSCLNTYVRVARGRCPHPELMAVAEKYYHENEGNNYNFAPAQLQNASLKSSALPNSNFAYLLFEGASFDDTDLNESFFSYNNAEAARFGSANISKCKMYRCDFSGASFVKANVSAAEFLNCCLTGASFERALMLDACFLNSDRERSYLAEAGLIDKESVMDAVLEPSKTVPGWRGSVYAYSDMQDCNMQSCIAPGAIFVGINFDRSMFGLADMKKAFFSNCLFRWVDMYRVNFAYTLLLGSLFDRAALNNMVATNARLFACVFSECNMIGANFTSCRADNVAYVDCDFSGAKISNARFVNCLFKNVNFNGADISKTHFDHCTFKDCCIDGAVNDYLSVHKKSTVDGATDKWYALAKRRTESFNFDGNVVNSVDETE